MTEPLLKTAFFLIYVYILLYYYVVVNGRVFFPTATNLVVLDHTILFIGTLVQADIFGRAFDLTRLSNILVGMLIFVAGARVARQVTQFLPKEEYSEFKKKPIYFDLHSGVYWWTIVCMGAVATLVGAVQAQLIGYAVPWEALELYIDSGDPFQTQIVYSSLRKGISNAVIGWVAPGYVMQFTQVLLPIVVCFLYIRVVVLKRVSDKLVLLLFLLPCLYFLTIRGQRGPIVNFALWFLFLVSSKYGPLGNITLSRKRLPLVIGILAAGFYVLGTVFMRRNVGFGEVFGVSATGIVGVTVTSLMDLLDRVVLVTSRVQLFAMDVLHREPFSWGRGWLESLSLVLPGYRPSLANRIGQIVTGDLLVSGPVDLWSSIWLDFGWIGMVFIPFVIGFLLQRYTIIFFRGKKTATRIVVLFVASFTFIGVGEPIGLFNNGFVTLVIYYYLVRMVKNLERKLSFGAPRTGTLKLV